MFSLLAGVAANCSCDIILNKIEQHLRKGSKLLPTSLCSCIIALFGYHVTKSIKNTSAL